jgi:methionyl-tRNA synthetase
METYHPENLPRKEETIRNLGKVGIFVAWPYCNGPRHIGHAAALAPADVIARYSRARGADVMMVSGTDEFGTPNLLAAEKKNIPTKEFVDQTSAIIRGDFQELGMSFDWFTRTTTSMHEQTAQHVFSELVESGFISKDTMMGSFDSVENRSLPDRYVEGVCPKCKNEGARGDQCDNCSSLLDPTELVNPHSALTGNSIEFRPTEHYFLNLDKLKEDVSDFLKNNPHLRKEARNMSEKMIPDLRPRAITRDLKWGVPLPSDLEIEGEDRVLYVWFEAVIGYLSASIEWANQTGDPEAWKQFWDSDEAKNYYVMGKDNVPFHTIIWPAIIAAKNSSKTDDEPALSYPQRILSTGNLNFGNDKFSSSRGNVVYLNELLPEVGPDALRYYLIAAGPENSDSSFTFESLVTRTNNELIAKWGNLISRTANLINRDFDGVVPSSETRAPEDEALLNSAKAAFDSVGELIDQGKFSASLAKAMEIVSEANKYIYDQKPWEKDVIESGRNAEILATLAEFIENMNKILCPFIPHASQKINTIFGDSTNIATMPRDTKGIDGQDVLTGDYSGDLKWEYGTNWSGNKIQKEKAIVFKKLDLKQIEQSFA